MESHNVICGKVGVHETKLSDGIVINNISEFYKMTDIPLGDGAKDGNRLFLAAKRERLLDAGDRLFKRASVTAYEMWISDGPSRETFSSFKPVLANAFTFVSRVSALVVIVV